jgi:hypothetical protein
MKVLDPGEDASFRPTDKMNEKREREREREREKEKHPSYYYITYALC